LREVNRQWRVVAGSRPPLTVHYDDFNGGRAATVRLQSSGTSADVIARVSDLSINVSLDAAAFEVAIPPDAEPLTLDELRRAGPLGER
jgi:hypothetical protein